MCIRDRANSWSRRPKPRGSRASSSTRLRATPTRWLAAGFHSSPLAATRAGPPRDCQALWAARFPSAVWRGRPGGRGGGAGAPGPFSPRPTPAGGHRGTPLQEHTGDQKPGKHEEQQNAEASPVKRTLDRGSVGEIVRDQHRTHGKGAQTVESRIETRRVDRCRSRHVSRASSLPVGDLSLIHISEPTRPY